MTRWFYTRLALTNIRKNAQTYTPYIWACTATVMMFYNMLYLLLSKEVTSMHDSSTVRYILLLGCIVTGFFSFILLVYINSFLIKRRKKEFGLFHVLGMEKKHIARIMLIETVMIALLCIGLGLLTGILFSKLALLLLLNILDMDASFGLEAPVRAIVITCILFAVAFMINLIYNIFQVHASKPVQLLKGGNVGEKEPRTKWLMALMGAASLGGGYYIAITAKSPITALALFFVAVMLVIIGTYCLFTAGSIAVLKALRRNKRFYYRTNPFIAVSGMIYRMKQNAAGLASICILSTAVIIMLSSTVSLYAGLEDSLRNNHPREISLSLYNVTDDEVKQLDAMVDDVTKKFGIVPRDPIRLRYVGDMAKQSGHTFDSRDRINFSNDDVALLAFVTVEEYNRIEDAHVELSKGEAIVYVMNGKIPGNTLDFNGFSLNIHSRLDSLPNLDRFVPNQTMANNYVIIAGEQDIVRARKALNGDKELNPHPNYEYHFDTSADADMQADLVSALRTKLRELPVSGNADGREAFRQTFLTVYGGLFFLGLFLGTLFILGTVLIIYYKQISEGYDDKNRFAIMLKVGLSHDEIKKAIRYQVLSVFFLPLVMAVIHIAASFSFITRLLALINMTNIRLFALCTTLTILVFAVCYALIYSLTARTYYRIVR